MKHLNQKIALTLALLLLHTFAWSQTVPEKVAAAFQKFEQDPQLQNAISSLYITEAQTGKVVFDKNSRIGLAPASTMKIITSVSAYELLGKGFRYETKFAYRKNKQRAEVVILPSGDPTLGSWRWAETQESHVLKQLTKALQGTGVKSFSEVKIVNEGWNDEVVPDGWMWQDIANYYGAGPAKLNWRENQYDVILKSGPRIGDPVSIVKTVPALNGYGLRSELTSAAAGTGDNAYIYFPLNAPAATIRGTIPVNEGSFKISGAMPSAGRQFVSTWVDTLQSLGIKMPKQPTELFTGLPEGNYTVFHTIISPPLDSIVYWFNRKSINLYGEALVKTIAFQRTPESKTGNGLKEIRAFWQNQGVPETELIMVDGSGLSPLNRVTTHAQVMLLQHARTQPWYSGFYTSLPVYNGMKMKSGTIRGVKGYCGYHKGKDGKEYVFSFLVNNYNGSAASLVKKMYQVLDELK